MTRHELDGRGARLGCQDTADNVGAVAAVLGAVGGVDLVIQAGVGFYKGDVFLDAARLDAAGVARLCAAKPWAGAPFDGADE